MIDVYLCDDEPLVRQQIQLALERKILIEGWDMEIVCSVNNPMTLLDTLTNLLGICPGDVLLDLLGILCPIF